MEAATLPSKKTVNKGKIKKTLKNILCRPDPIYWPEVQDDHRKVIESALNKYKVSVPLFKKPHWKDLKNIPKEKRPKPPKIEKIEGLLFGTTGCSHAIKNNICAAVIIESTVNPRSIVQPVIEACIDSRVPVICVNGLRSLSATNFGIPTSCLGIQCDCLPELQTQVLEITKNFNLPEKPIKLDTESIELNNTCVEKPVETKTTSVQCPYLYRTSKKTRVFNPSEGAIKRKSLTNFIGQDFIEFTGEENTSGTEKMDRNSYMKMVLKKISNNPKRVKVK